MIISLSQNWPGAILTLFCFFLVIVGAQFEAGDAAPAGSDMAATVTIKLTERAPPPMHQPLAQPPPVHLRPRVPRKKKNKQASTVTQMVTLTKSQNATTATVFVTKAAETVTNTMRMTLMSTQTVLATPNAPQTQATTQTVVAAPPAAAAPAGQPSPLSLPVAAAPSSQGLASVLTLGFLSSQSMSMVAPPQAFVDIVTEVQAPTTTGIVFAIATETRTSIVTLDEAKATGSLNASMSGAGMETSMVMATSTAKETGLTMKKSEAISGRKAGNRCIGFGAVVVAVAVAVVIL